jgi:lipoate-protein ligase A
MLLIERPVAASAAEFHHREVPTGDDVLLWWFEPLAPALVLGSTQSDALLDRDLCRARGVDVVKRHSGGGLVLVSARHTLWADVILPSSHPAWRVDIGRASEWMGEVWLDALSRSSNGFDDRSLTIHRGAHESSTWSKLVCFAGRGPGEIFDERGRKVVGISQRRTRSWARFQCAMSLRWEPSVFADLIIDGPSVSDIEDAGFTVGSSFDATKMRESFAESLQSAVRSADAKGARVSEG